MTIAQAQTNYQRVWSFGPWPQGGNAPRGELLEAADGLLYGTTYAGGSNNIGTVFKIAKDGSGFAVLISFEHGSFPYGGLVESSNGVLYGASSGGGSHQAGTVFRLNSGASNYQTLHEFNPASADGNTPTGALLKATDHLLYGTTIGGGTSNYGTIYTLNQDGSGYAIIHNFLANDGSYPAAGLIQGADGRLYGTAKNGGSNDLGTIFSLNLNGSSFKVLHNFSGKDFGDGSLPLGTLLQGTDGFLYGTTYSGGSTSDLGTVFRLSMNGSNYAILHVFGIGGSSDGAQPVSGLTQGRDGALYGTVPQGGPNIGGLVFKLGRDGSGYSILHTFTGRGGDGSQPFAPLLQSSDGAFYGSTYFGGDYTTNGVNGTLFRLSASPPQVRITALTWQSAGAYLTFAGGAAGQLYQIQAATNSNDGSWQTLGAQTAAIDGGFWFLDTSASNFATRFYRSAGP